jgi:hypothetical protein
VIWACDFLTQYNAFFAVAYVFVILEIGSRRIVHVNVTTVPMLRSVKQTASLVSTAGAQWMRDPAMVYGRHGRDMTCIPWMRPAAGSRACGVPGDAAASERESTGGQHERAA